MFVDGVFDEVVVNDDEVFVTDVELPVGRGIFIIFAQLRSLAALYGRALSLA
jgi:hypothetical protein